MLHASAFYLKPLSGTDMKMCKRR